MQHKESLLFNYSDIFFTHYFDDHTSCSHSSRNHALTYIYSGEMIIEERNKRTVIGKGECAFIKRDNQMIMTKQPKENEQYKGIFIMFTRKFLRDFFQKLEKKEIPSNSKKFEQSVIKLPNSPEITSLFQSMTPYFDTSVKPKDEFMQLKLQESIYTLLAIDERFYPTLFDFNQPWKIDIIDFMEENYMYELSIEDIAHYTGRSLATFKRDFKKISTVTPQKWLIKKRLKVAYDKLHNENKKVSDVYIEVGFKNLSHFSSAYKKEFGYSPSR